MSETSRPWYTRIGPGLITVCVIIGPGSILTSSSVGAKHEYDLLWVIWVSVIFMLAYMLMGAKLGVVGEGSPGDLLRKHAGKWLAVLVGASVFFIASAFQSGNNLGVVAVFESFVDSKQTVAWLVVAFNALALVFLFLFRDTYQMLEKLMTVFVGIMLLSFAVNLFQLHPDPAGIAQGLIPSLAKIDLPVLGLLGTTFSSAAAIYQAYLVRQKGWSIGEMRNGVIDTRVAATLMALITMMLMSTAAAGLYTGQEVKLTSAIDVGIALEPTFGQFGKAIFCIGLFSAAYSSFIVNSMIAGYVLSDGLGLGSKGTDFWPRVLTAAALLLGMFVALAALLLDFERLPTIIAAQAVTVITSPLVAGVLFWLTCKKSIMGDHANGPLLKAIGAIGFVVLVGLALNTAFVKLPSQWAKLFQ